MSKYDEHVMIAGHEKTEKSSREKDLNSSSSNKTA